MWALQVYSIAYWPLLSHVHISVGIFNAFSLKIVFNNISWSLRPVYLKHRPRTSSTRPEYKSIPFHNLFLYVICGFIWNPVLITPGIGYSWWVWPVVIYGGFRIWSFLSTLCPRRMLTAKVENNPLRLMFHVYPQKIKPPNPPKLKNCFYDFDGRSK